MPRLSILPEGDLLLARPAGGVAAARPPGLRPTWTALLGEAPDPGKSRCCKCRNGVVSWSASGGCSHCKGDEVAKTAPPPEGCMLGQPNFRGNHKCAKECRGVLDKPGQDGLPEPLTGSPGKKEVEEKGPTQGTPAKEEDRARAEEEEVEEEGYLLPELPKPAGPLEAQGMVALLRESELNFRPREVPRPKSVTLRKMMTDMGPHGLQRDFRDLARSLSNLRDDHASRLSWDRLAMMTPEDVPEAVGPIVSDLVETLDRARAAEAGLSATSQALDLALAARARAQVAPPAVSPMQMLPQPMGVRWQSLENMQVWSCLQPPAPAVRLGRGCRYRQQARRLRTAFL